MKIKTKIFAIMFYGLMLSPGSILAADIPQFQQQVSLQAVEQSVPAFIESLFSQIGVPVKVNSQIPGSVNGAFNGTAEEVFSRISQAFNVFLYYDKTMAYVYPPAEISSSILPISTPAALRVVNSAREMGWPDAQNTVSAVPGGGLMVSGSTQFIDQIKELSNATKVERKVVRAKKSPIVFRLFKLKYAWADDVQLNVGAGPVTIPGVATMLRRLISEDGSLPLAFAATPSSQFKVPKLKGQGLQSVASAQSVETQSVENVANSKPTINSDFSIVAQPQLNAIAIRDRADRMPLYETLIESLDVEPEMVEIEATIIDINVDRTRELGINWRLQGSDAEFLLGDGTASDQLLQPGQTITPQGEGGVLSLVLGDSTQFFSRVRALEREGAANVVSKPHVLTLSNVEAVLGSTTEFFVRVAGLEEVDLFKVPVGTVLRVTPHVYNKGGNNGIKLLVNIEDGSTVSGSLVDDIPVVERSSISTQALIAEGSSLLIGGLVRESSSESEVGVPVLGKVPFLGRAFRSTLQSKVKKERLFLITPRIASSDPKTFDTEGPVLQGEPLAIIANADRIGETETTVIAERTAQIVAQVQNTEPAYNDNSIVVDDQMTLAMLRVPEAPQQSGKQDAGLWNQWSEVGFVELPKASVEKDTIDSEYTEASLQAVVSFEETNVGTPGTSQIQTIPVPRALAPEPVSTVQTKADSKSVIQLNESQVGGDSGTPLEVEELADGISLDLKARRLTNPSSNNALEKIFRMKQLSPDHDYALNGEKYIARIYASIGRKALESGNRNKAALSLVRAMELDVAAKGVKALRVALGG